MPSFDMGRRMVEEKYKKIFNFSLIIEKKKTLTNTNSEYPANGLEKLLKEFEKPCNEISPSLEPVRNPYIHNRFDFGPKFCAIFFGSGRIRLHQLDPNYN